MKKLFIMFAVFALVVAFSLPAAALENVFGGYHRTRIYTLQNFTGEDETEAQDWTGADTRTRLYYTAKFSDNLKFVTKFEMDAVYGDDRYGDFGADGIAVEVKNTYLDFSLGAASFKVGVQGGAIGRGLVIDNDWAGINAGFGADAFSVNFLWMKPYEGGTGLDANDMDVDVYALDATVNAGPASINPFVAYVFSEEAGGPDAGWGNLPYAGEVSLWYLGVGVDVGPVWFTGIYQGGDLGDSDMDVAAFALVAGAGFDFGPVNAHGSILYGSGDDDAADDERNDYFTPGGMMSYYWAEILGYGTFDRDVSAGSPADQITNLIAVNGGVSFKAMPDLTLSLDLWYATLAEDNAAGDNELGIEIDFALKYMLLEKVRLDFVAAYLAAGDATYTGDNEADPIEVGARLSIGW